MVSEASPSRAPGPVDRAFALLQIVTASHEPIGVRDLARRSGLAPSTTARTLGILTDLGMVERTADGAARPGPGLATLTSRVEHTAASWRHRLRPLAIDLVAEFGENAAIAIDDGDEVLYIVGSRVDGALQVPDPTDERFPCHLVAPGLVAMAHWNTTRLETYLEQPLAHPSVHSVTSPQRIRTRLRRVRRDGHAWTDQELDIDVNGLAVPIRDRDDELVAIASLYGPAHRFNPNERPELARELHEWVTERTSDLF